MKRTQPRAAIFSQLPWDVLLFFALYVIAPSYCAIEVSSRLPLLTLSRALLVLMGVMLLVRRRKDLFNPRSMDLRRLNFGLTGDKGLRRGMLLFFALLILCDIALLPTDTAEAVKALFVLIAEGYVLVWMLALILTSRERLLAALEVLVVSSGVVAIIASIGCVIEFNPFHLLDLVRRDMLMNFEYRLGLVRAAAGFGHPVYYGAFCAVMCPISMYFVEQSEKKWKKRLFSFCLAMNIVGVVLSNSRGSLLSFGCMVLLAAAWNITQKSFKKFFCTYFPIGLSALLILALVSLLSPIGLLFLQGVVNSVLNIFSPDVSMDLVAAGDRVISYGINEDGLTSRLIQLSGIPWTLSRQPLFGFGCNAHVRGLVAYEFDKGIWLTTDTFDVGPVAIICQYGLVGLLGYIALFGSLLKTCLSGKYFEDHLMRLLCLAFVTYMVSLLTIASLDKMLWVLIAAIVCLTNIIRRENQA